MASYDSDRGPELQSVSLEDFRGLDRGFYEETTRFFEGEQFTHVGDVEDLTYTRKHPFGRICVRLLVEHSGTTQAAIYQIPPSGIVAVLLMVTPLKYVELETEFSDGEFLATTNNGLGESNPHVDKRIELKATPEDLLELHRDRVQTYLEDSPSVRIRPHSSLGDALEAQQRQHLSKARPAKSRSRRKSRTRSRRPSRLRVFSLSPAAIGKIAFVVGISLLVGVVGARQDIERYEEGQQLTLEKYLADFESHREESSPQPGSDGSYLLGGLLASGAVIGLYELVGGIATAVGAIATGGCISMGTHLFLSVFGSLLVFIGGVFVIIALVGVVEKKELPRWVSLPVIIIGPLTLLWGFNRFIDAVPVPCRKCGGKACRTSTRPVTYECRDCRHAH